MKDLKANQRPQPHHLLFALVLATAHLAGCATSKPVERPEYVGEWGSSEMYLLILADGTVRMKRLKDGSLQHLVGPLKSFSGDDMNVGLRHFHGGAVQVGGMGFLTKTLKVSDPPYEEGGEWKMTVDGVTLTKIR